MQRRNHFFRFNVAVPGFFLILLLLFNGLTIATTSVNSSKVKTGKIGRHFILLLDSEVAVNNISKKSNTGAASDDFFNFLKHILEQNPYSSPDGKIDENDHEALGYKTFKEGRDIVSIVLHHFSATNRSTLYFYTFTDIIFIEKFLASKSELIDSLNRKFGYYKTFLNSFSPEKISGAEERVLPFLCSKHNSYKKYSNYINRVRELGKYTIEDIVIISIYDAKNRKNITSKIGPEWEEFNNNFQYNCIKRDRNSFGMNIAVDYFSVKPRQLKNVPILKNNKETLERFAKLSPVKNGQLTLYWRGYSGLTGLPEGYRLQWSGEPKTGPGDFRWEETGKSVNEDVELSLPYNNSTVYLKKSESKEARSSDNTRTSTTEIYYRLVKNDYNPEGNLKYPLKYSPSTAAKRVIYAVKAEKKYVMTFPWLWMSSRDLHDEDLISLMNRKSRSELSAAEASRIFKRAALTRLIAVYAAIILLLVVFYLGYLRNPKIKPVIYELVEEVLVDFSQKNRGKKALADLEFQNTRKRLSKLKKKKTFDIELEVELGNKPGENNVDLAPGQLLVIEKIFHREIGKEPALPLKWMGENCFRVELAGVSAEEKFKIILNTGALQDLTAGNREEKDLEAVLFEPGFNIISAVFTKKRKPVPLGKKSRSLKRSFNFIFRPEAAEPDIQIQQVKNEGNVNFRFDREYEKYTIPYSTLRLQQALFKLTITNKSTHKFSRPVRMELSYKVFEENALLDSPRKTFYLTSSDRWNPGDIFSQTREINLSYGEEKVFYFFINFKDILENPKDQRNFRVQVLKNGIPIKDGDKNISVTGSIESTEALLCFKGENEPVWPEEKHRYSGILNEDKELVINEESKTEISLEYRFPEQGRLDILSGKPTPLFGLELRNSCITHTGWYKWDIYDLQLIPNEYITLEKTGSERAIYYKIYKGSKKIEDTNDSRAQVEFYLDAERVRIKKYEISFGVTFVLDLLFFPGGEEKGEISRKKINISAVVEGRHYVVPDYLVIDFGTSAIAVERRSRTGDRGEQENTFRMQFNSPRGHLESKNGLMPSVISLNENEIIGSHRFVSLPAEKSLMSREPGKLVSSPKMRILEGEDRIEFPANFSYINKDGVKCTGMDKDRKTCTCIDEERQNCERIREDSLICNGDHIDLEGLLLSTYRNLKQNYLNPSGAIHGYKRLIITHPNLYNQSHITFLKQNVLFNAFVDPAENIYEQNIILVSESDASLYYYLQKNAEEEGNEKPGNIMVIDIGGGTLDISLAEVKWEKSSNKPESVEITRKDGVAFAGDVLDKAIALQVHDILRQYEEQVKSYGDLSSAPLPPADDIKEQIFRKIEEAQEQEWTKGKTGNEESTAGDIDDSKFRYEKKIAAEESGNIEYQSEFVQAMLDFKYENILAFKENMCADTSPGKEVEICLGGNGTPTGLCQTTAERIPLEYNYNGKSVKTTIESGSGGNLYLKLKRKDWFGLPFLSRFTELFIDKIHSFFGSDKKNIPDNLLVVLSGRTSLWPDIPRALKKYLGVEPRLAYKNNRHIKEKGLKMKQAVAEGALQKVATWGYIPFKDVSQIGKPAVRYQTGPDFYNPDCWTVKTLDKNNPVEIDLGSSDVFHLGINTSMDFVPFMGANYFERKLYCNKNMKVSIFVEEYKEKEENEKVEWEFFIQSDKYKRRRLLIEHGSMKYQFLNLRGTNWPIKTPQLPEVGHDEFDERI
jgi:hypothetical protein